MTMTGTITGNSGGSRGSTAGGRNQIGAKRRGGESAGGGYPLPQVGVRGASPGEIFEK